MLRKFDRQDLVDLHRLVMKRFKDNTLEGYNLLLWADLKIGILPEYKDTAGSGGNKDPEALVFHKKHTEEDSDRYITQCFVNGLYAPNGEINLEKNDNLISNNYAVKLCLEYENVGNLNGYNDVQNVRNQNGNGKLIVARAEGNATGHNGNQIRCYNCRGMGHFAKNCMVRPRRRDAAYLHTQLLIAQKKEAGIQLQSEEFDLMAAAADLDEIEEVNANCILMANLQQASTLGTQTDKAPVYDSDGSAEVHNYEYCYDNDIFNMFTQEEQYTELLEPIPESHQVPHNDNNVISEVTSMEQSGETVEQHPANVEETRALYDSLYQNLAIEVEKVNTVNCKLKETNVELTTELARFKNQEKCFEISQEKSGSASVLVRKRPHLLDYLKNRRTQTFGAYDHEAGSSRPKRSRHIETVEEALLLNVHHEFLKWNGCSREARSRYNTRLATLLPKLIYSPHIMNWQFLHKFGYGKEIDQMLKISLKEAESNEEIFFSIAWVRAFNIQEPMYPKLCHEFYSTYEFDEVCVDVELQSKKIINFRLGGHAHSLTLLQFSRRLGLYHAEELDEEGVDADFQGVLHKMITYGLCQRTTGYEKIKKNDLWAGSQKDSQICCGQFISKIAMKSRVLTEEIMCTLSALVYYRSLDMTTLRELINSEDRLIHDIPVNDVLRVATQRAPRVQRASMQDLYEHMGNMEIRQEAIERMKYR
uniref:Retrotransposon Orf1 n=1 Tax=Tanacetum cinerariifolium TaxID=118510 RepID=A0A6L2NDK2_TANCI|nr:retrotransposon Orf1 [Tanacetum cinerariifolium]